MSCPQLYDLVDEKERARGCHKVRYWCLFCGGSVLGTKISMLGDGDVGMERIHPVRRSVARTGWFVVFVVKALRLRWR